MKRDTQKNNISNLLPQQIEQIRELKKQGKNSEETAEILGFELKEVNKAWPTLSVLI